MPTIDQAVMMTGADVKALIVDWLKGQGIEEGVTGLEVDGTRNVYDASVVRVLLEPEDLDPVVGDPALAEDDPRSEDVPDEVWIVLDRDGFWSADDKGIGHYASRDRDTAEQIARDQSERWPGLAPFKAVRVK